MVKGFSSRGMRNCRPQIAGRVVDGRLHAVVEFPNDSPITGPARQKFLEFMISTAMSENLDQDYDIVGGELSLRFDVTERTAAE